MRKFKKLLSCVAATALAATSLLGGTTLSANADTNLITDGGPYTGNATFIANYPRSVYYQQSAFEIKFQYTTVGEPAAPQAGEPDVGFNDTFEFLVYDTNWGGWNRTTVGPNGYDATGGEVETPNTTDTYSVTVPISAIESKLTPGTSPYGINLQTGAQLGTSAVKILSLDLISGIYVQQPFTISGTWQKGVTEGNKLTVDPATAATVNATEWNIEVTAIDLNAWTNPTIDVTVTYDKESVDAEGNYAQAEIMLPTGVLDEEGNMTYAAVDPNYVDLAAGTYTFTTEVPNTITSFIAAYDLCTVTEIKVYNNTEGNVNPDTSVKNQSASTIAKNMGVAWDLGNSLEASTSGVVNEKDWGNPKTTKKLIQAVKAAGFNTIRVPISYMNTIDGNNQIDDAYMARIQQVVSYAYDMGMYVVIDIHNDGDPQTPGSWINISTTGAEFEAIKNKFAAVWTDIANNFAGYDQRLIFEAANELVNYSYSNPTATEYSNINALDAAFVEAVRNAEGTNNDDRVLMVVGFGAAFAETMNGFVKPSDPTPNRLMLDVHYYEPKDFCWDGNSNNNPYQGSDSVLTWYQENEEASVYGSKAYMQAQFSAINNFAGRLGMPVFIGEYGPESKVQSTTSAADAAKNLEARANYDYWLNYYAAYYGIVAAYWDNGATGLGGSALFNRINNVVNSDGEVIIPKILSGYQSGKTPPED